ncbi:MAG: 4Fe-4S binding protein [Armatimonadota bacterium]|nr:4Fe-4S binding protein [Armatimonadota bacterium]
MQGDEENQDPTRNDAGRFSVRLRVATGILSADQLGVIRDVAIRYGQGYVCLGAKQEVEIPGVSVSEVPAAQAALQAAGLSAGNAGARGRNVAACAGAERCAHAFLDARALGRALEMLFGGDESPVPVKIAVAGCPNACTAPQVADIGFVGMVEPVLDRGRCTGCGACAAACDKKALTMRRGLPRRDPQRCDCCGACLAACPERALRAGRLGYTVYVGGKVGRYPQVGSVLARFVPEEEVPDLAGRILGVLREHGQPRERLFSLTRRLGIERLRAFVHSRPLHRIPLSDVTGGN